MEKARATFSKRERLTSEKLMEQLFEKGKGRVLSAFPLRMVFMLMECTAGDEPVQVLISVPKKRLKHAVDRNRVKRQIREAYRLNKQSLIEAVPEGKRLLVAFVWQSDQLSPSTDVESRLKNLLKRTAQSLV